MSHLRLFFLFLIAATACGCGRYGGKLSEPPAFLQPDLMMVRKFHGSTYSLDVGDKEYSYWGEFANRDPGWAGLAISLSVFWEAVTEPVMGHVSNNTRSPWGRHHPYMLSGGLLMALCCYPICTVPGFCRGSQMGIFWYLVSMNLLPRTGLTMFFIPYMAPGFEMCGDYQGRLRLQGIRQIFNMAISFSLSGAGWCLSGIGDQVPKDGKRMTQTPLATWNPGMVTFVTGAAIRLVSLLASFIQDR